MRAALVTGAAHRIGAVIARHLAADGWHVVLHYARSEAAATSLQAEIERNGGRASLVTADLAAPQASAALIERSHAAAPGLELLVNNASRFEHDDLESTTAEALSASFSVNAAAPILLAQRFAALLPPDRTGNVVNILDNRVVAPNPDFFAYGISKFALLGATRMMALALAPRIRVNGIAPGITLVSGDQTPENFANAHRLNPLGRGCTPEEIAAAVAFVVASPSMTGSVVTLDGGQALANPGRDVQFIEARKP